MTAKKTTSIVVAQDHSKLAPLSTSHITPDTFKDMPGYTETMERAPNTIDLMVREAKHLLVLENKVKEERGKLLIHMRTELKLKGQWLFWLHVVGYDDSTAAKHIEHYLMMQELPEIITRIVNARGVTLSKKRVHADPPPIGKELTEQSAIKWVQKQTTRNFYREIMPPPDGRELLVMGATGLRQLVERADEADLSTKEKRRLFETLGGVLLGLAGIQSPITVHPAALPEEAKPKPRGAPRGPRKNKLALTK